MKQDVKFLGLFIVYLLVMSACSVSSNPTSSLEGVWTWEDVELTIPDITLKTHVLILKKGTYEEVFFSNTESRGIQEGSLLVNREGDQVEFATTGNIQTVYKGSLSGNLLIISSINNKTLNPPALYKRS
ncbi:MAG: hypothetical protein ACRCWI_05080 [Brevinema sp.]